MIVPRNQVRVRCATQSRPTHAARLHEVVASILSEYARVAPLVWAWDGKSCGASACRHDASRVAVGVSSQNARIWVPLCCTFVCFLYVC